MLPSRRRIRTVLLGSSLALASVAAVGPASASAAVTCQGYTANIVGSEYSDVVRGNPGIRDVVALLGGNDTYIEDGSGDIVCLGDGDDTFTSWSSSLVGNDVINGGPGNDYIVAYGGADVVNGMDGDDTLYGLDGNDSLDGGAGNDYVAGGAGSDTVVGAGGLNDRCFGELSFMGCESSVFGG